MDGNSKTSFPCKTCITLGICKGKTREIIDITKEGRNWITMAEMADIVTHQMKSNCSIILEYIAELKYVEHFHDYGNFKASYYVFMRNGYF